MMSFADCDCLRVLMRLIAFVLLGLRSIAGLLMFVFVFVVDEWVVLVDCCGCCLRFTLVCFSLFVVLLLLLL